MLPTTLGNDILTPVARQHKYCMYNGISIINHRDGTHNKVDKNNNCLSTLFGQTDT